jgi:hypothetical protein
MVWPWVMPYPIVHFRIRVPSTLGAEFPYGPLVLMFLVQVLYELVERVSVIAFWIRPRGARGSDY